MLASSDMKYILVFIIQDKTDILLYIKVLLFIIKIGVKIRLRIVLFT